VTPGRAAPRVVSLIASSTEMICALGCGEWLVARSHECDHPDWVRNLPQVTRPKFALDGGAYAIDQRVRALVEQGVSVYEVDAERLAALRPDVIVTQTQCEVCAVSESDVLDAVRALLPGTRVVALHPGTLDDIWRDVVKVASALAVPDRGVQMVAQLRRRMQAIATRCAAFGARPRVACIEWIDPVMVAGHWTPELIRMGGGEDALGAAVARAPYATLDEIAAADPDVILVAPCGFGIADTRDGMPALESRPEWSTLRAVREGRVFLGDGNAYFNRPGPRVAETLEIVAEILHPEAFRFGHEGTGWVRRAAPEVRGR
jgi:iron complex transport system substrate-binding protein